jgi:hypothetical protein
MDGEELDKRIWTTTVLDAAKGLCANCGSEHKVSPRLIVPEDVGGKRTLKNSVVLCRACELASSATPKKVGEQGRRLVNIWVSVRLYDRLQERKDKGHTGSMGALVRYLMSKYVAEQTRFDDIAQYQDNGADVRLNVWVDADLYATFKTLVDDAGLTVTSALKSLFCMYEAEATPLVEAARRN